MCHVIKKSDINVIENSIKNAKSRLNDKIYIEILDIIPVLLKMTNFNIFKSDISNILCDESIITIFLIKLKIIYRLIMKFNNMRGDRDANISSNDSESNDSESKIITDICNLFSKKYFHCNRKCSY